MIRYANLILVRFPNQISVRKVNTLNLLERWIRNSFKDSVIEVSKLSMWINVDGKDKLYLYIVKTSTRYYKLYIVDLLNNVSCYSTRSILKLTKFLDNFVLNLQGELYIKNKL